ncbi:metal-sensitive transcriptional regulator [Erythrobacter cryptus]|uniref:metal-sensitive transcriptional regulator n=1 Tax=Erythrobacter cryptus TaxID=196588 RepID=UPI00040C1F0C
MKENTKAKVQRLNRIAGQVRGVAQMIADERYCIEILQQIAAIRAALAKVESQVLKSCRLLRQRGDSERQRRRTKGQVRGAGRSDRARPALRRHCRRRPGAGDGAAIGW